MKDAHFIRSSAAAVVIPFSSKLLDLSVLESGLAIFAIAAVFKGSEIGHSDGLAWISVEKIEIVVY
jgi:hypothetical protein